MAQLLLLIAAIAVYGALRYSMRTFLASSKPGFLIAESWATPLAFLPVGICLFALVQLLLDPERIWFSLAVFFAGGLILEFSLAIARK